MSIFDIEGWITLLVIFVLLVISIFAFVNSLLYSARSYEAAGKLNKASWALILALAIALELFPANISILRIAAIVAPLVYLADVRPALSGLYRR